MTLARIPSYCAVVFIPRSSPTSKDHLTQLSLCATSATHAWPDQMATIFFAFSTRLARKVGLSHAFPPLHRIFFKRNTSNVCHTVPRINGAPWPSGFQLLSVLQQCGLQGGAVTGNAAVTWQVGETGNSRQYMSLRRKAFTNLHHALLLDIPLYIYTPKVWSSNLLHEDFTTTTRGFPGL